MDKKINKQPNKEKELEEKLLKALADFQNLQRDMAKRLDVERTLIRVDILKSILNLADDIDLAVAHSENDNSLKEGILMIKNKFQKIVADLGASIIDCKAGDNFDPFLHEAIGVVDGEKDGTINQIVQNGYKLGEIVIRPTRVLVNKLINNKKCQK